MVITLYFGIQFFFVKSFFKKTGQDALNVTLSILVEVENKRLLTTAGILLPSLGIKESYVLILGQLVLEVLRIPQSRPGQHGRGLGHRIRHNRGSESPSLEILLFLLVRIPRISGIEVPFFCWHTDEIGIGIGIDVDVRGGGRQHEGGLVVKVLVAQEGRHLQRDLGRLVVEGVF